MKLPDWLQKEQLYEIIFESDTKRGKLFDEWLIFAILVSLIVSFVKSVDTLLPGIKDGLDHCTGIVYGAFHIWNT